MKDVGGGGGGFSDTREIKSNWSGRRYQALVRAPTALSYLWRDRKDHRCVDAAGHSRGTECACMSQRTDKETARQAATAGDATCVNIVLEEPFMLV